MADGPFFFGGFMGEVTHASLGGADLHQPYGVETASDNAIAQASSGSVVWSDDITVSKLRLSDTAWDDVRVSMAMTNKGAANSPDYAQFKTDGAGSTGVFAELFDAAAEEEVFFDIQLPHRYKAGTNLRPHVHWSPTSIDTGSVVWGLEYTAVNIDGTFGNTTLITIADAAAGVIGKHQLAQFAEIDGSGFEESTVLMCRFYRKAADASDTYTDDAAALSFDVHVEVDKLGTDDEYPA